MNSENLPVKKACRESNRTRNPAKKLRFVDEPNQARVFTLCFLITSCAILDPHLSVKV